MNDNEATIPQRIAHLEGMAGTHAPGHKGSPPGLANARDERLGKPVSALEGLLKHVLAKVERLQEKRMMRAPRSAVTGIGQILWLDEIAI